MSASLVFIEAMTSNSFSVKKRKNGLKRDMCRKYRMRMFENSSGWLSFTWTEWGECIHGARSSLYFDGNRTRIACDSYVSDLRHRTTSVEMHWGSKSPALALQIWWVWYGFCIGDSQNRNQRQWLNGVCCAWSRTQQKSFLKITGIRIRICALRRFVSMNQFTF